MLRDFLEPYRTENRWTMDALVNLAAEIIPKVAGPQARHKVTEVPDARTVRYYIQEGLVDRPHGFSGPTSLFAYRHLLQLLAIKVLQSLFLPIRRIKDEIQNLKTEELESRVESWAETPLETRLARRTFGDAGIPEEAPGVEPRRPAPGRDAAQRYLESLSGKPAVPPTPMALRRAPYVAFAESRIARSPRDRAPRAGWSAMSALRQSIDTAQGAVESSLPHEQQDHATGGAVVASGWRRFELFPGIELHVREEAEVPEGPSFLSVLASRLRVILEHMRRKP